MPSKVKIYNHHGELTTILDFDIFHTMGAGIAFCVFDPASHTAEIKCVTNLPVIIEEGMGGGEFEDPSLSQNIFDQVFDVVVSVGGVTVGIFSKAYGYLINGYGQLFGFLYQGKKYWVNGDVMIDNFRKLQE